MATRLWYAGSVAFGGTAYAADPNWNDITQSTALSTNLASLPQTVGSTNYTQTAQKNNVANQDAGVLTSDRVHLNVAGNRFVADVMLKSLGQ